MKEQMKRDEERRAARKARALLKKSHRVFSTSWAIYLSSPPHPSH
jgi:hypothetical protein